MPIVLAKNAREFNLPNVKFSALASPLTGSTENSVWQICVAPKTPPAIHQLTREEIIVALSGTALVSLDGEKSTVSKGDVIIVPPFTDFSIANETAIEFTATAILPVGGQAIIGTQPPFTPPWAT